MQEGGMGYKSCSGIRRWQNKYAAALHETDRSRLAKCIEAAEAAVLSGLETMIGIPDNDHAESEAIVVALTHLETLKRERLGFCGLSLNASLLIRLGMT